MALEPRPLSVRSRTVGIVAWSSFLAACAGTMVLFAFVSPEDFYGESGPGDMFDRVSVYTIGFFGLWLLGALASTLALWMNGAADGHDRDSRNARDS